MATKDTLTIVRFYSDSDPYSTEADNRPLNDLKARDDQLGDGLDSLTGVVNTKADKSITLTAGNGLVGGGDLSANRSLDLGTPGTLSTTSTNSVSADSHTHAITFPVTSVAGKTGAITLVKGDVGLSNVDNTSDVNKPISTATQTALNGKAASSHTHAITDVTNLQTTLEGKAPSVHGHEIADVNGLEAALEAAGSGAPAVHTHTISDVTNLETTLNGKANSSHTHNGGDLPSRTDWVTRNSGLVTVGQLGWKNFGDAHTIFDASAGTTPTNAACSNSNPDVAWDSFYPTLMGYNGTLTYGVRVDRSRYAETAVAGSPLETTIAGKFPSSGGAITGKTTFSLNVGAASTYATGQVELMCSDNGDVTLGFHRSGTSACQLRHSGNGLILSGTSATTAADFFCYGNVSSASDLRLKTDVERITNALEKVSQLNGYTFNRINSEENVVRATGVIAQEVEKVLPEAVSKGEDGYLSVYYGNMVGLLIESIKDLKAEITQLKSRIEEIERNK